MFAPIRALLSHRPNSALILVAGAVAVSLLFAATPFLIPLVAEEFDVSLGAAGLLSAVQVAGFAVTTFVAGRRWRASHSKMVAAAVAGIGLNAGSALTTDFGVLLAFRLVVGATAGVFTWLAWADAMRDTASMRRISAVGPISVLVGAPLLAWIGAAGGASALYWSLAVTPLPVLVLRSDYLSTRPPGRRRMSPSRSNVVLLVALGVLTMAGSSLFVFTGAFGVDEVGLGAVAVAVGFSVNAGAGLAGAWWPRRPTVAWPWMIGITLSASTLVAIPHPVAFYGGMFGWGFAFWMAIPRILSAVADWSLVPDERVGDAQSIMAVGRAVGPVVGAVLVGAGSFGRLGVFSGTGLALAGLLVGLVERYRRGRDGPRDMPELPPGSPPGLP